MGEGFLSPKEAPSPATLTRGDLSRKGEVGSDPFAPSRRGGTDRAMLKYHFEDFEPGAVAEYGPRVVTRDEITAFASQFDPQPMHLDEEAARKTMLGGLAASGWHSCAIAMRMMCDWFLLDTASWGAPGVESLRWQKPVRPDDKLTLRRKVLEKRVSKSRPEMGLVRVEYELINQSGESVLVMIVPQMIGVRAPQAVAGAAS